MEINFSAVIIGANTATYKNGTYEDNYSETYSDMYTYEYSNSSKPYDYNMTMNSTMDYDYNMTMNSTMDYDYTYELYNSTMDYY